jgi:hypothetical protein
VNCGSVVLLLIVMLLASDDNDTCPLLFKDLIVLGLLKTACPPAPFDNVSCFAPKEAVVAYPVKFGPVMVITSAVELNVTFCVLVRPFTLFDASIAWLAPTPAVKVSCFAFTAVVVAYPVKLGPVMVITSAVELSEMFCALVNPFIFPDASMA